MPTFYDNWLGMWDFRLIQRASQPRLMDTIPYEQVLRELRCPPG